MIRQLVTVHYWTAAQQKLLGNLKLAALIVTDLTPLIVSTGISRGALAL